MVCVYKVEVIFVVYVIEDDIFFEQKVVGDGVVLDVFLAYDICVVHVEYALDVENFVEFVHASWGREPVLAGGVESVDVFDECAVSRVYEFVNFEYIVFGAIDCIKRLVFFVDIEVLAQDKY